MNAAAGPRVQRERRQSPRMCMRDRDFSHTAQFRVLALPSALLQSCMASAGVYNWCLYLDRRVLSDISYPPVRDDAGPIAINCLCKGSCREKDHERRSGKS